MSAYLKPLEEWTLHELATYNQAHILMAIPTGEFNDAVFSAMDLTLRWKAIRTPVPTGEKE